MLNRLTGWLEKQVDRWPPTVQRTLKNGWPVALIGLAVLSFFGIKVLPLDDTFIGGIDVAKYSYWNALYTKEQFLSGDLPLWNPYYYSGHPFMANPQTFTFYPFTLLFIALPLPWAFNLTTVLHLFLAGLGTYYFVLALTHSRGASIGAAIIFCLSGYQIESLYAGHLAKLHTAAFLPWIMLAVERGLSARSLRWIAAAGALLGLQILGGDPQNNLYTALFLTLYFFARGLLVDRRPGLAGVKILAAYPLIPLIAFGVAAIQILPSAEFISLSDRADNTYDFATFFSFPIKNLYTFLVAKPNTRILNTNWELAGYFGIIALVLALVGGLFGRKKRHALCFFVLTLVVATIMFGRHTPIYKFYYDFVPGIAVYRIPARCMVVGIFFIAALAGLGIERLATKRLTRIQQVIAIICLGLLFGTLVRGAESYNVSWQSEELRRAAVLMISALVIIVSIRFLKKPQLIIGVIAVALFADLYLNLHHRIPQTDESRLLKPKHQEEAFLKEAGHYRVASTITPSRSMKFRYFGINGRTPICLGNYYEFVHKMAGVPIPKNRRHTLNRRLFSKARVFSSKVLSVKYAHVRSAGRTPLIAENAMPRAVVVSRAKLIPVYKNQLSYMKSTAFNPLEEVVLTQAPILNGARFGQSTGDLSTGRREVKIKELAPHRITLSAVNDQPAYLVLSELFYPGWRAFVDGEHQPILRANFLLRALPLRPGRHDIEFSYRPQSLLIGALITFLTLALGGVYWIVTRKRYRS